MPYSSLFAGPPLHDREPFSPENALPSIDAAIVFLLLESSGEAEAIQSMPSTRSSAGHYRGSFYGRRRSSTLHAAKIVLGTVFGRFAISSLVDVGCGTGTWLKVAEELGAKRVVGVEGPWLPEHLHEDPELPILTTNLEHSIDLGETFDLCVSLEVAEHLSDARAAGFVDDLCRLSNRVLFSAAVPGQGGRHHVNERWQSHWADLFCRNGYGAIDLVRPAVWQDSSIPFWYRQNTILYLRTDREAVESMPALRGGPLDVVHPELFAKTSLELTVDRILRLNLKLPRACARGLRRWWRRRD